MLLNYLKIALRHVRRHKVYSGLNIVGLSVGLAACLLIALYVQFETSFDRFHANADRIYRVEMDVLSEGGMRRWGPTFLPIGPLLREAFPEIEQVVRVATQDQPLIQHAETRFYEDAFRYAEPSFFEIFDFEVLRGAPSELARPGTIMLSELMATKYYGGDDPLGQTLTVANKWNQQVETYEIVGILEDTRLDAHFQVHFLASMATLEAESRDRSWSRLAFTYVLLRDGYEADDLAGKLPAFQEHQLRSGFLEGSSLALRPLTDIHLRAALFNDIEPQGDIRYVYLFSAIAALILLIACINYMNLATARSAQRAREVGVRKVVGAQRRHLAFQFLGESVLLTSAALLLGLILAQLLLPSFSALIERPLTFQLGDARLTLVLAGIVLVVGLTAGGYPALLLSSFRPVDVLKGAVRTTAWPFVRKSLVVFQFAVSAALIVGTLVIQRQLDYVQNTRLGFEKEQMLILPTRGRLADRAAAFKQELAQLASVQHVTVASAVPGRPNAISWFDHIEGYDGEGVVFDHLFVDYDYIPTLGLEVVAGRTFSDQFPTDAESALLINETAARQLGWVDPIGKTIQDHGTTKSVIGVLRDFHVQSMKHGIKPMIMEISPASDFIAAKLNVTDLPSALAAIHTIWDRFIPMLPFQYAFLDDDYEAMYRSEQRLGHLFGAFALFAVVIACLGLFGLAAFVTQQRTKEIGIRKVLGASVASVVGLLSRDFLKLVCIAFLLAAPLAYFAMERWLDSFAYRVDIGIGTLLSAGALALVTALLTVSYQAARAALADPVKSLRYE